MRNFRVARGLTQAEVAEIVGVCRTTVHFWEKGQGSPTIEQLERLAAFCDCTIWDILNAEPQERRRARTKPLR